MLITSGAACGGKKDAPPAPATCPPGQVVQDGACIAVVTPANVAAVAGLATRLDDLATFLDKVDTVGAPIELLNGLRQLDQWQALKAKVDKLAAVDAIADALGNAIKTLRTFKSSLGEASARLGNLKGELDRLNSDPLTRAQVASRLGVSVSTVRRFEGERLHPQIGPDDVRLFDVGEVGALAAELADEPRARRLRNAERDPGAKSAPRSADELAAEVFERLEQRQSLAEIVVGVRIAPERVRDLHEQWCRGLVEGQLRFARTPQAPLDREHVRIRPAEFAERLGELPEEMTRISVARYRGPFLAPTHEGGEEEFAWVTELGGFHVSGPCEVSEIVRRFGKGDYRVSAYGFNPPGLRWEVIVKDVPAAT